MSKLRRFIAIFVVFVFSFIYIQMFVPARSVFAFGVGVPMPIVPISPVNGATSQTIKDMSEAMQQPIKDIAYFLTGSVFGKYMIARGYSFDAVNQTTAISNFVALGKRWLDVNIDKLTPSSSVTKIVAGIFGYASSLPSSTTFDGWIDVVMPSIAVDMSQYVITDFNNITTPFNTVLNSEFPVVNDFPFVVNNLAVTLAYLRTSYVLQYANAIHWRTGAQNLGYSNNSVNYCRVYTQCVNPRTGLPLTTLFLNTSTNTCTVFDSAGNTLVPYAYKSLASLNSVMVTDATNNSDVSSPLVGGNIPSNYVLEVNQSSHGFSWSTYDDLVNVASDFLNAVDNAHTFLNSTSPYGRIRLPLSTITSVVFGDDITTAQPITNIDNFGAQWDVTNKPTIDNLSVDTWLSPFVQIDNVAKDIVQTLTDALFIPADTIRDVSITIDDVGIATLTNADAVSLSDVISEAITGSIPKSDVFVPPNLFDGVWKFVDYLWSFTKPLVLYTKDLLDTFTLSDGGGISWIVYGVIVLAFTGGVVSKFLQ